MTQVNLHLPHQGTSMAISAGTLPIYHSDHIHSEGFSEFSSCCRDAASVKVPAAVTLLNGGGGFKD